MEFKKSNLIKIALCLLVSITILAFIPAKNKWVNLFNGKNFNNFEQKGGKAIYTIENGEMVGTAVPNTPNSFLCTKKEYSNFILEVDVKVDTLMNSGIQIRSHSIPTYKDGVVHGYQVEIDPSARAWSGGLYEEQGRGWLFDLKNKPEAQKAFNRYGWNHYRIEAIGSHFKTFINNIPCTDYVDSLTAKGFIAFQVHSLYKKEELERQAIAPLKVRWKNIRIKEIE